MVLGPRTLLPSIAEAGPAATTAEIEGLVTALGSDDWRDRESAQALLLKAGLSAVAALEKATASRNPELAHRARFLLDRIDPEVTEFRIFKVLLTRPFRIAETAELVGPEGKELLAKPAGVAASDTTYAVQFRTSKDGSLDIQVAQSRQGAETTELRTPLSTPGAVSVLKTSEEAVYRRMGLEIQRERSRFLTLLWTRHGRLSHLKGGLSPASGSDGLAEELTRKVLEQARSPMARLRLEALGIAAVLGLPEAESLLREALGDPAAQGVAALGLGGEERLVKVLREAVAREDEGTTSGAPDFLNLPLLVAQRLVDGGQPEGLRFLLATLGSADAFEFHVAAASIADALRGRSPAEEEKKELMARACSPDVLSNAPWDDLETEHFYSRIIGLADPRIEVDRSELVSLLDRLERLLSGELGVSGPPAKTCLQLWRRAAGRLPPAQAPSSLSFFLRVLPSIRSADAFSETMTVVEEVINAGSIRISPRDGKPPHREEADIAEVRPQDLATLYEVLVSYVEGVDPTLATKAHQWLLRISRSTVPAKGQLPTLIEALLRVGKVATEASTSQPTPAPSGLTPFAARQTEMELARLTGVPAPTGKARKASGEASFDGSVWREWLSRSDLVAAREKALAQGTVAGAAAAAGQERKFVYYEFDVEIKGVATGKGQRPIGPRPFEILDGRRLEVSAGVTAHYRDRWGNELRALLELQGKSTSQMPERVRVNRRALYPIGLPILGNVYEREIVAVRYEAADVFPGARPIVSARDDLPTFRTLILVVPAEEDRLSGLAPANPVDVWTTFLATHILGLEAKAPREKVAAVLSLLKTLSIEGASSLLRRLFDANPTAELARLLHDAGDAAGLRFLVGELGSPDLERQIAAAIHLSELGRTEGAKALLDALGKEPSTLRRYSYQLLNAFDAYLQNAPASDLVREAVLDCLGEQLSDPTLQYRAFQLIEREMGTDFGYNEARSNPEPEKRRAAVESAIQRAKASRSQRKALTP